MAPCVDTARRCHHPDARSRPRSGALDNLLVEHAAEILTSCTERLDEIGTEFHPEILDAAREAVAAYPVAPKATQALAASVFENVLRTSLGYPSLNKAAKKLANTSTWKESSFRLLRWALIRSCMPRVLAQFVPTHGEPVPGYFNRHATVHTLDPVQYTATNALVGVMLIVTTMRELYQLDVDGFLDRIDDDWEPEA